MLAKQAVGADGLLTLDVPRKCLCEGLDEPLVDEIFASALFQPQPRLFVNFRCAKRHTVFLLCGKILAWLRHIRAFQRSALRQIDRLQFGEIQFRQFVRHIPCRLTTLYFFGQGLRFGSRPAPGAAPDCSVFRQKISHFL